MLQELGCMRGSHTALRLDIFLINIHVLEKASGDDVSLMRNIYSNKTFSNTKKMDIYEAVQIFQ